MDFKKYYRAIETLAELSADLKAKNSDGQDLRSYILVEEDEKSTEYYKIIY